MSRITLRPFVATCRGSSCRLLRTLSCERSTIWTVLGSAGKPALTTECACEKMSWWAAGAPNVEMDPTSLAPAVPERETADEDRAAGPKLRSAVEIRPLSARSFCAETGQELQERVDLARWPSRPGMTAIYASVAFGLRPQCGANRLFIEPISKGCSGSIWPVRYGVGERPVFSALLSSTSTSTSASNAPTVAHQSGVRAFDFAIRLTPRFTGPAAFSP